MRKPAYAVVGSLMALVGGFVGLFLVTSGAGCQRLSRATPSSEDEKAIYALGLLLGRNVSVFNLTPHELDLVKAGLSDAVLKGKPQVDLDKYTEALTSEKRRRALKS